MQDREPEYSRLAVTGSTLQSNLPATQKWTAMTNGCRGSIPNLLSLFLSLSLSLFTLETLVVVYQASKVPLN